MKFAVVLLGSLILGGCSDWIFRIDIPQGNFLEKRTIEDLRVGMTKEQVLFVLGRPLVNDSFNKDTWYYVYDLKRGMRKRGEDIRQDMLVFFENDKVVRVEGDFDLPESFYEPIE